MSKGSKGPHPSTIRKAHYLTSKFGVPAALGETEHEVTQRLTGAPLRDESYYIPKRKDNGK